MWDSSLQIQNQKRNFFLIFVSLLPLESLTLTIINSSIPLSTPSSSATATDDPVSDSGGFALQSGVRISVTETQSSREKEDMVWETTIELKKWLTLPGREKDTWRCRYFETKSVKYAGRSLILSLELLKWVITRFKPWIEVSLMWNMLWPFFIVQMDNTS